MFKRLNISKWLGVLFAPIEKNGAFFVFMFALGYLCTQLEIMPYYLRDRGAKPYELSVPELFLDLYIICVLLALIPRKVRIFVRTLLYVILYGVAIADMYCYERFESTLTPTMLMLVGETTPQEAGEFLDSGAGIATDQSDGVDQPKGYSKYCSGLFAFRLYFQD